MPSDRSYCQWCGDPATTAVVVEPAEFRTIKGVKTQTHRERKALACERCARVERQEAPPKEVERARKAAATKKWRAAQEKLAI